MLLCICSVIDHKWYQNTERTKIMWHCMSHLELVSLMFLPHFNVFSKSVTEQRLQNMKFLFNYMITKPKTAILWHQLKCTYYLTYYIKWNVPFKLTSCLSLVLVVPIGRMSLPLSRIFFTCQKYHLVHRGATNGKTSSQERPRHLFEKLRFWLFRVQNRNTLRQDYMALHKEFRDFQLISKISNIHDLFGT